MEKLDNVTLFVGNMGSGKTTVLAKLAYKYYKRGYAVYSNVSSLKIGKYVSYEEFGTPAFRDILSQKSIYFCDEAGLEANNRSWKTFPKEKLYFLKMCRKYQCKCVFFSQTVDIDKAIRDLSKYIYIVNKFAIFTNTKRYRYKLYADVKTKDRPYATGEIVQTIKPHQLLFTPTFRPLWYRLFDTTEKANQNPTTQPKEKANQNPTTQTQTQTFR